MLFAAVSMELDLKLGKVNLTFSLLLLCRSLLANDWLLGGGGGGGELNLDSVSPSPLSLRRKTGWQLDRGNLWEQNGIL